MTDDESRDTKSPDRQDASLPESYDPGDPGQPIRAHLEALDHVTRALLTKLRDPATELHTARTDDRRREARRRCREIRAETCQLGIQLIGPEAAIPYHPDGRERPLPVITYSGPLPEAFEAERTRRDDDREDGTPD